MSTPMTRPLGPTLRAAIEAIDAASRSQVQGGFSGNRVGQANRRTTTVRAVHHFLGDMAHLVRIELHGTAEFRLRLLGGLGVELPHHPAGPFDIEGQHAVGVKGGYGGPVAQIDWVPFGAAGHGAFAHRMVDRRGVKRGADVQAAPLLLSQLDHDVPGQGAVDLVVGVGGMQGPPAPAPSALKK